jgi:hypothetical protein
MVLNNGRMQGGKSTATCRLEFQMVNKHLRHSTIGHHDRIMTDLKAYFESELAYRRAKDSYT